MPPFRGLEDWGWQNPNDRKGVQSRPDLSVGLGPSGLHPPPLRLAEMLQFATLLCVIQSFTDFLAHTAD